MKNKIMLILLLNGICLSSQAIKPIREYTMTPSSMNLFHEEFMLKTADGANIKVWHLFPQVIDSFDSVNRWTKLEGEQTKNTSIIISYGDMGNMGYWLNHGISFAMKGYDVWLYDYRGFGESSDFAINQDYLYYSEFETDLSTVVQQVKKAADNKICLFGLSMGTIISINYLNLNTVNIDYYIADGQVYSPENAKEKLQGKEVVLPENTINYDSLYAQLNIPMFIIFSSEDRIFDKTDLDSMKIKNGKIQIMECNAGHLQCFYKDPQTYVDTIDKFLTSH
jgi:pimeloyl-ACP methyl ester carboxylesterase